MVKLIRKLPAATQGKKCQKQTQVRCIISRAKLICGADKSASRGCILADDALNQRSWEFINSRVIYFAARAHFIRIAQINKRESRGADRLLSDYDKWQKSEIIFTGDMRNGGWKRFI
jgi:hypothetical protein